MTRAANKTRFNLMSLENREACSAVSSLPPAYPASESPTVLVGSPVQVSSQLSSFDLSNSYHQDRIRTIRSDSGPTTTAEPGSLPANNTSNVLSGFAINPSDPIDTGETAL